MINRFFTKRINLIVLLQVVLFAGLSSCTEKLTSDATRTTAPTTSQLKSVSIVSPTSTLVAGQTTVPTIATATLFAGQTINAGSLVIKEVDTNADGIDDALAVSYNLTNGWLLKDIHLWIGSNLANMPKNNGGNPVLGSFPYTPLNVAGKATYTVNVPFAAIGYTTCSAAYFVAAHASVYNGTSNQTAWSAGTAINPKGAWGTYSTINVTDNTPASITGSIEVVNVEGCSATDAPPAVATVAALEAFGLVIADARTADANLLVTSSDVVTGSCPTVVTRTYTITDACGNKNTVAQTINVQDHTAPTAAPLAPVTVQCAGDVPAADIALVSASDNCSTPVVAFVGDASNGAACSTVITRTYSVTDACGNSINVTQTINVIDVTAPVLSGQGAAATITAPEVPSFTAPTATDNCDQNPVITFADVTVAGATSSTVTRTWTATDACGNASAPVSQTITVNPAPAPPTPVTPTANVTYVVDSAFGGSIAGAGNAWWFIYNGSGSQTLWAGQTKNAGTVEKIGGSIVITLAPGFELEPGNTQAVKIQGYNSIPASRPSTGGFALKGTSLTVAVGSFPYYVVHVDVRSAN